MKTEIARVKELFPRMDLEQADYGRSGSLVYVSDWIRFNLTSLLKCLPENLDEDACWLWKGNSWLANKYPLFGIQLFGKRRMIYPSRLIPMIQNNSLMEGKKFINTCNDLKCVNPAHYKIRDDGRAGRGYRKGVLDDFAEQ